MIRQGRSKDLRNRLYGFRRLLERMLTKDPQWYYRHPLFVHPEQRAFVREQLKTVNWDVHRDKKWQESHQRQWKKVLNDPGRYYDPQAS